MDGRHRYPAARSIIRNRPVNVEYSKPRGYEYSQDQVDVMCRGSGEDRRVSAGRTVGDSTKTERGREAKKKPSQLNSMVKLRGLARVKTAVALARRVEAARLLGPKVELAS